MLFKPEVMEFSSFFSIESLTDTFNQRIAGSTIRGVDGTTVKKFQRELDSEIQLISERALAGKYKFSRYKEKLIVKSARSLPRQISVPSVRDALALRALCDYLAANCPDRVPEPPHRYIKDISELIKDNPEDKCFVRLDIKNFYPTVCHNLLLNGLFKYGIDALALNLTTAAISSPTGKDAIGTQNKRGIPQGLSVSNILASIYFKGFDNKWAKKQHYFRYVDDILVICPKADSRKIMTELRQDLSKTLKLVAHKPTKGGSGKTTTKTLTQGVDYLGYTISDQPLKVRKKSYRKVLDAIVKICTRHKFEKSDAQFLWKLNLRITGCTFNERSVGWVFYFRQMNDMDQLHRLDGFVKQMLRKYGRSDLESKVLNFVKTYREIRFNRKDTKYIPNFDKYTLDDMVKTIVLLTNDTEEAVRNKTEDAIKKQFFGLIKKQTDQLEQETIDFATS